MNIFILYIYIYIYIYIYLSIYTVHDQFQHNTGTLPTRVYLSYTLFVHCLNYLFAFSYSLHYIPCSVVSFVLDFDIINFLLWWTMMPSAVLVTASNTATIRSNIAIPIQTTSLLSLIVVVHVGTDSEQMETVHVLWICWVTSVKWTYVIKQRYYIHMHTEALTMAFNCK